MVIFTQLTEYSVGSIAIDDKFCYWLVRNNPKFSISTCTLCFQFQNDNVELVVNLSNRCGLWIYMYGPFACVDNNSLYEIYPSL